MTYVLLWAIFVSRPNAGGATSGSQEFSSLAACERAKIVIEKSFRPKFGVSEVKATCIIK